MRPPERPECLMWMRGGVDADDKLDRGAAGQVLRRSLPMLRPYRGRLVAAALLRRAVHGHDAGRSVAGPGRHRRGHQARATAPSSTGPSSPTSSSPASPTWLPVPGGDHRRIGEDFLRDLRVRVFDHLQRLSMPFYDREKAGVVVSRMTSDVDSLSELVQMGLLMFVQNSLLLFVSVVVLGAVSWKLLLLCLVAVPPVVAASIRSSSGSPTWPISTCATASAPPCPSMQEGISGVRVVQAFAREDIESSRFAEGEPRPLRRAHALGEDRGLVPARHRDRRPRHHGARGGRRRLLGAPGFAHHRNGDLLRPHPVQPVRADPAAQPAVQHRAVGRRRPREALRPPRHRHRRARAPGSRRPPEPGRHRGPRAGVRLRPTAPRCSTAST